LPGTGGHLLNRRGKVEGASQGGPEGGEGEFDFQEALQGFNKEEEFSKLAVNDDNTSISNNDTEAGGAGATEGGGNIEGATTAAVAAAVVPEVKKYNKSSFFDDLSSGQGMGGRPTLAEERKTNMDTFGVAALHNPNNRRFGGGRGGGRGGPYRGGGGRGGGRGRGGHRGGRGGGRGYAPAAQGGGGAPVQA